MREDCDLFTSRHYSAVRHLLWVWVPDANGRDVEGTHAAVATGQVLHYRIHKVEVKY